MDVVNKFKSKKPSINRIKLLKKIHLRMNCPEEIPELEDMKFFVKTVLKRSGI